MNPKTRRLSIFTCQRMAKHRRRFKNISNHHEEPEQFQLLGLSRSLLEPVGSLFRAKKPFFHASGLCRHFCLRRPSKAMILPPSVPPDCFCYTACDAVDGSTAGIAMCQSYGVFGTAREEPSMKQISTIGLDRLPDHRSDTGLSNLDGDLR